MDEGLNRKKRVEREETSSKQDQKLVFECQRKTQIQQTKGSSGIDCPLGQDDQPKTRIQHSESICGGHPVILPLCHTKSAVLEGETSSQHSYKLVQGKYEQKKFQPKEKRRKYDPQMVLGCPRERIIQKTKGSSGIDCPLGQDGKSKTRLCQTKGISSGHSVFLSLNHRESFIFEGKKGN